MSKKIQGVPEYRFKGFTDDWEQRKLGEVYDFYKGKGLRLDSFTEGNDKSSIAYGHLYTKYSEVITKVNLSSTDEGFLSKSNDVLFPGSSTVPNGTAQANAILLDGIQLGGDIIIAREKVKKQTYAPFMSYQINAQRTKLFPITVGTTITHMYGKDLAKLQFCFPIIEEQEKIGEHFKQYDQLITLHQRELEILGKIKKTLLNKMFV